MLPEILMLDEGEESVPWSPLIDQIGAPTGISVFVDSVGLPGWIALSVCVIAGLPEVFRTFWLLIAGVERGSVLRPNRGCFARSSSQDVGARDGRAFRGMAGVLGLVDFGVASSGVVCAGFVPWPRKSSGGIARISGSCCDTFRREWVVEGLDFFGVAFRVLRFC